MTTRVRIRWGGEWSTKGMGKGCLLPMFVVYLVLLGFDLFLLAVAFFGVGVRVVPIARNQELPLIIQLDEVYARGLTIRLVTNELERDELSLRILDDDSRLIFEVPGLANGVSGAFTGSRWTAYGCVLVSGSLGIESFTLLLAPNGRVLGAWWAS